MHNGAKQRDRNWRQQFGFLADFTEGNKKGPSVFPTKVQLFATKRLWRPIEQLHRFRLRYNRWM